MDKLATGHVKSVIQQVMEVVDEDEKRLSAHCANMVVLQLTVIERNMIFCSFTIRLVVMCIMPMQCIPDGCPTPAG